MEGSSLKSRLRTEIRHRRRTLDSATRRRFDQLINRALQQLVEELGIASLSAFLPFDGEPDITASLSAFQLLGLQVALPVVADSPQESRLQFRFWRRGEPLQKSPFGIEEPAGGEVVVLQDLDMVLMPLVAWDEWGHRLGMGAGYYDRALATVADHRRPLRVGIAYQMQKVTGLPVDPWDVPLHIVITEIGSFTCLAAKRTGPGKT